MRVGRRAAVVALLALVSISTGRSLANGFAFDDVPIIVENPQIHELAPPWVYAGQSYWPPRNLGDAYRPWTTWAFALQYAAAGPAAGAFHVVSLVLTAAVTLLVFALALERLPLAAAFAGAALFAVHPVHVEATANVVGQAELWMALFAVAAVLVYARARRHGDPGPRARLAVAGLYLLACASKEQGIVVPALLLAWEGLAVADSRPWTARLRGAVPLAGLLAIVGGGFLLARHVVLGDLGGGPPAAGLAGRDAGERLLVMLPVVLQWLRLLVWPRHLAAQYSPPAVGADPVWSGAAVAGAAVVVALAGVAFGARKRAPLVSLGLCWAAVAILPVSNVPFPTGVLIAERTLFLPSVGATLAVGGMAQMLASLGGGARAGLQGNRQLVRVGAVALVGLVGLGAARSWSRQAVWKSNDTLFAQTIADQPLSYRAWFVYARDRSAHGDLGFAGQLYERAGSLYAGDRRVFEEWGFLLRRQGRCDLAVPVLVRGVAAEPSETLARSRLFECLVTLGRHDEALAVAEAGVAEGSTEFEASVRRARELIATAGTR